MALYRQIFIDFWNDPKVTEEMSAEDRYTLLYILTNPYTTQIGIYQITKRQIAFDLGYSTESVGAILERFEKLLGLIKYNSETRELAIKNWGKYNLKRGGKPVLDCIKSELAKVKDKTLIEYVAQAIPNETIKELFLNNANVTSNVTSTWGGQEKEEEEEEEKEEEKDNGMCVGELKNKNLSFMSKLYQENIGTINGITGQWIIEISEQIDIELFKRALEICTERGNITLGYLKGIIKKWLHNNITTYEQLKAYELQNKKYTNNSISQNQENIQNYKYLNEENDPEFQRLLEEEDKKIKELNEKTWGGINEQ